MYTQMIKIRRKDSLYTYIENKFIYFQTAIENITITCRHPDYVLIIPF